MLVRTQVQVALFPQFKALLSTATAELRSSRSYDSARLQENMLKSLKDCLTLFIQIMEFC